MPVEAWNVEELGFRGIFEQLIRLQPDEMFDYLLSKPVLTAARELMEDLRRYRVVPKTGQLADHSPKEEQDLWELYALSRINDFLLDPLTSMLARSNDGDLRVNFFTALGFEAFNLPSWDRQPFPYSPFHHEFVDVAVSRDVSAPQAWRVRWAGLRFGDLLFARAGVVAEVPPGTVDPFIAERSVLYFAYRRPERRTYDLSVGWGHNSQWRTRYHRFYEDAEHYYFNVDGILDIASSRSLAKSLAKQPPGFEDPASALPIKCRRELLIYRHFISCRHADKDLWPWDDTLTLRKDAPLFA
jgi:hypothetical protein